MAVGWPKFELAVFTSWDSVPDDVRAEMLSAGIPQRFFGERYAARSVPSVIQRPDGATWVRFGDAMLFGGIYLDLSTGAVLEVADFPGATAHQVNSTLERFTNTVKTVIALFPFYSLHGTDEERTKIAGELSTVIEQIDPGALDPDNFWGTFIDDVIDGDFAAAEA